MAYRIERLATRWAALSLTASLVVFGTPALADVEAGVDAWSVGNYEAAVSEWQGPAEDGDADAMFYLARAYLTGRGVASDYDRGKELYAKAASKGHIKAADNYGLLLYQQGGQVEAMPLIRASADRGDPRAQYILGLAHFNADYAERDWVRAYALVTMASSSGLAQASNALSQMDQYIPLDQRREAQDLVRDLEERSVRARAAQLAKVEIADTIRSSQAAVSSSPQPVLPQVTPTPSQKLPVVAQRESTNRASATAPDGRWKIQLGAFGVRGNADRLWDRLSEKAVLVGARKELVPSSSGRITRLLASGYPSRPAAERACNELKKAGQDCLVTDR